jgi:arylsulfatase
VRVAAALLRLAAALLPLAAALLPLAAALLLLAAGGCDASRRRPDVVLVTVDTLRADRLHAYGYGLPTSPRIDELAEGALLFRRAVAAAPAAAPAHGSIMSSRYPREHSIGFLNGDTRLEGSATLAEHFREAGYRTGAFVSSVVLRPAIGLDRGFDVYDGPTRRERGQPHPGERIAEETTQAALAWVAAATEGPFFLWVHYQDPHGPYAAPGEHRGRFHVPPRPGERPLPVLDDVSGQGGIASYQALDGLFLPSQYEGRYADEILYADGAIGALIDGVDARRGGRQAIVLLTSDHGEALGEADRWFVHGHVTTPELAHVPFLLRAPGLEPGRADALVSHVDVMPTLLELAGLAVPEGLSGLPLGPYLREGRPLPERIVYCDVGWELGAYGGDGFLRLATPSSPWSTDPGHVTRPPEVGFRYEWPSDGSWSLRGRELDVPEPIARYAIEAVPMRRATSPEADELDRLRALGYVPGSPPEPAAPRRDGGDTR